MNDFTSENFREAEKQIFEMTEAWMDDLVSRYREEINQIKETLRNISIISATFGAGAFALQSTGIIMPNLIFKLGEAAIFGSAVTATCLTVKIHLSTFDQILERKHTYVDSILGITRQFSEYREKINTTLDHTKQIKELNEIGEKYIKWRGDFFEKSLHNAEDKQSDEIFKKPTQVQWVLVLFSLAVILLIIGAFISMAYQTALQNQPMQQVEQYTNFVPY